MKSQYDLPFKNGDGTETWLDQPYYVSGFAGPQHRAVLAGRARIGDLLVTTRNIGSSKDVEVAAWQDRLRRGEVSRIVVVLHGRIVEDYHR